jgi:REP element-mobilizing transposase RayT
MRLHRIARTLRNGKLFAAIHQALDACRLAEARRADGGRPSFRIIEFSVQCDHIHLIVEADDPQAFQRGIKGLAIRIARALNRRLERCGPVFADRYHARVLGSPTEVRHALLYVINNARHHAAERGETYPRDWLDPFSSAADFAGWSRPARLAPHPTDPPRCTSPPVSWVLRGGWRRAGSLDPAAVPGRTPAPAFD